MPITPVRELQAHHQEYVDALVAQVRRAGVKARGQVVIDTAAHAILGLSDVRTQR